MPDGSKQVTKGAVGSADVDQSIWHVQSALHDLCLLLADTSQVHVISLAQLKDLDAMVAQATRAKTLAAKFDLPVYEFNS